jgi:hypothetical protein
MNEGAMIFALDKRIVLLLTVSIVLGLMSGLASAGLLGEPARIWGARGTVVLLVDGLLLTLAVPLVLRWIHSLSFAQHWWFPWLDGEWIAEVRSNWPRVRRTLEAARSGTVFDAFTQELPETEEGALTLADVTIRVRLFTIDITLKPRGTRRTSRSRFVRPQWCKPLAPELSYVYEQTDDGPLAITDARQHFGAGHLLYDADTDTLRGEYWTQRRSEAGINTAGAIVLRRRTAED